MASTAVVTAKTFNSIKRYSIAWTSDASAGTIDNTLQDANGNNISFDGMLISVTTIPGTAGDQPDDNYIMVILNEDSVDVFADQGAALDESDTVRVCPMTTSTDGTTPGGVPFALTGTLTLDGQGAGNGNKGTIVLEVS